ncbi:hypothetical protein KGG70_gp19 [Streptomyces phage Celia]|uniref:Uncharacterized protein n=1 Tax=Streptomyces phage Celia TaxID=2590946 RepID=A0A516KRJ6_9CAUD|nr:hypothetical protein KGG70_gp19 [Streptomyces phage Celia]QDP44265.1 hypothetical protein SEA_CELIA_62 [Streptomyces phage Celia]QFG10527.1 hypothetical protein SEA_URZA_64 [Streptomyces phage Urza]QJD50630.1 hypothetical protein SEA_ITZA_65 [Streptomyces phage Itza]
MSVPVPGTGRKRYHRTKQGGVSASSRVIEHRYADEGEKGRWIRRLVRRRETRLWKRESRED